MQGSMRSAIVGSKRSPLLLRLELPQQGSRGVAACQSTARGLASLHLVFERKAEGRRAISTLIA